VLPAHTNLYFKSRCKKCAAKENQSQQGVVAPMMAEEEAQQNEERYNPNEPLRRQSFPHVPDLARRFDSVIQPLDDLT
jgi:hypothetical protein